MDDVRIKSVLKRAETLGLNGYDYLEKIASFDTVEKFQGWKNGLNSRDGFIVERLGRNNYLKVRNALRAE